MAKRLQTLPLEILQLTTTRKYNNSIGSVGIILSDLILIVIARILHRAKSLILYKCLGCLEEPCKDPHP